MLKKKSLLVQEVQPGSSSFEEYQRNCGEGSSTPSVVLVAVDKSGATAGFCGLVQDQIFLRLKLSIKAEANEESMALIALVNMALKISRERFPDSVVIIDSEMKNAVHLENLGFLKTSRLGDDCYRLVFPPTYSSLKRICSDVSSSELSGLEDISRLFNKIEAFEFVPLVWLQHLMDAKKLGESIVHIFVQLSIAVQQCQQEIATHSLSNSDLQNEALLLDFAWDRLNTGHFSEVDQCWRLLYAATSWVKSVRLASAGQYLNAVAAADLGLLMGDGIPNQLLQRYAQYCDSLLPAPLNRFLGDDITLSIPKSLPNSVPIKTFEELSKWDFVDQFLSRGEPVIVKGLNSHWPACKNWSFDYLHRILCHRIVPIEQGSKYTDNDWSQRLMTGSEFFSTLREDKERPLYLAQHRIFDQIPQLCDDFSLPLYCDHCEFENVDKNGWIGPGGTVSPLHTDPRQNIFCQIMGRKFFRLVSPSDSENVYAFKDGIITNTSQVDVLSPDLEKYPNFAKVRCWDGVVEAGDALFIPQGWWHLVSALSNSVSISFWFDK
uniref:JmjC domain-containing protein n=1 Tax=Haemonchus contortus TaxID=6289 RepID=A0A7I4YB09_HAECO|nr:Protein JMJD-5 [Haemonchus contortus]